MRVIHGLESIDLHGVVLTIGNFDGVHRGHQAILATGKARAEALGTKLVVMTFDPHPLSILTPERMPAMLTPREEKLHQLALHGADVIVVARSTPEFLALTAESFISDVIVGRFHPAALVEGASFGFGRRRQGNVETLRQAGERCGFEVEVVEPVRIALGGHPDAVISSSLVRQLLGSGMVDQVALCLGRPYPLFGQVTHGAGRGCGLGFPTANVDPGSQLVPAEGVYAARVEVDEDHYGAAVSIGHNPTFEGRSLVVEAHLLDFSGELYGRAVRVDFMQWLRGQQRFDSPEALKRQIDLDVRRTREELKRGR